MPYKSNKDLPSSVRSALPEAGQNLFRGAFNGFLEGKTDDPNAETQALAVAWAAVKQKFKKEGDTWVPKQAGPAKDHKPIFWDSTADGRTKIEEHILLDAKDVRITSDGYLVANPRVARTGIQIYKGWEVDRPQMDEVRVYRPPEEIFSKDSLRTFAYRPITDDHPPERVTADNWKKYSVGQSGGDIARDGEYVRVPMVVMDSGVVKKAKEDGKVEISVGYSTDLKWGSGTVPETGEAYDAIQTNNRVNHIAIVNEARGGSNLRLGDDEVRNNDQAAGFDFGESARLIADTIRGALDMSEKNVELKKVTVDSIDCEMTDTAAALVTRAMATRDQAIKDAQTKIAELTSQATAAKDASDKAIQAKDAEIVTLKKQVEDAKLSPAKLDELVKDRETVTAKARQILGDKLVVDGKTEHEIRRQLVDAKLGDKAKGWTDDQVKIAFDTLTADIEVQSGAAGVRDTATAFNPGAGHRPGYAVDAKSKAYGSYDQNTSNRWKGTKAAAAAAAK